MKKVSLLLCILPFAFCQDIEPLGIRVTSPKTCDELVILCDGMSDIGIGPACPSCLNGKYAPRQTLPYSRESWCVVPETGIEIQKTRSTARKDCSCQKMSSEQNSFGVRAYCGGVRSASVGNQAEEKSNAGESASVVTPPESSPSSNATDPAATSAAQEEVSAIGSNPNLKGPDSSAFLTTPALLAAFLGGLIVIL